MTYAGEKNTLYKVEISRKNPGAFLFMIDQSYSTNEIDQFTGKSLSEAIADAINKILSELILKCSKGSTSNGLDKEESMIKDFFHVGVLTYGDEGVQNGFKGVLGNSILNPIGLLAKHPLRIEERSQKISDGVGGILEERTKFPIWFEPYSNGGTPMKEAFIKASEVLLEWCDNHEDSFPPILINITDGEYTDGNPETVVHKLTQGGTNAGNVLVLNVHVSTESINPITFPDSEEQCPGEYGKRLYNMSSILPPSMITLAKEYRFNVTSDSKGYCMNADISTLIQFLDIGTRPPVNFG